MNYLEKVKEIYPNENSRYFSAYDYNNMLDEFGSILVQVDDADYQGDSRLVYFKDNKYGFLNFGWGSCSGCDSLQACNSHEDVAELMEKLHNDIRWFDSLDELKEYILSEDRRLNYCYHMDEWKSFVEQVTNLEEVITL